MDFFREDWRGVVITSVMSSVVATYIIDDTIRRRKGKPSRLISAFKAVTAFGAVVVLVLTPVSCVYDAYKNHRQNVYNRVSSYPSIPTATGRADAIAFYRVVRAAMVECDNATADLTLIERGTDPVSKYQVAKSVTQSCELNDRIDNLAIPRSPGHDVALALGKASLSCAIAANFRVGSALELEDGLKGNQDIPELARSRDSAAEAIGWRASCEAEFLAAVRPLGITAADLAG